MLTEDYCNFDIAKLLKEKGFDIMGYASIKVFGGNTYEVNDEWITPTEDTIIPTLQMAMKWLREVHHLHISIEMGFDVDNHHYYFFSPSICKFSSKTGEYQTPFGETEFDTYEEAAEAAIKYCLKN